MEVFIENGVDPNCCRDDGGTGLHTFLTGYCATTTHDEAADKRILRLLLERIDLIALDPSGKTILDSVFQSEGGLHEPAKVNLANLCLEILPAYKLLERKMLIEIIKNTQPEEAEVGLAR